MRALPRRVRLLALPAVLAVPLAVLPLALAPAAGAAPAGTPGGAASGTPSSSRTRPPADAHGRYIVLFRAGTDVAQATARLRSRNGVKPSRTFSRAVRGLAAPLAPAQVDAVRSDPQVALVAPDLPVHATGTVPVVAGDTVPTGVRRIAAGTTTTARQASSVNVAVIDTGVALTSPDLNVSPGVDCTGTGSTNDDNGHGTHVAGTIAARDNGSGVVGVAPGTHLDAVKVLDGTGSGTYSQIICGIDWVTATRTDADPTNDVAVANLSLGGVGDPVAGCSTTSDALHRAICSATAAGVTFVVAAGNDGWDYDYAPTPNTPAAYPEVLTVTASADSDGAPGGTGGNPSCYAGAADDRAAGFSNWATSAAASAHTIAAPGTCITSLAPGGGTAVMSGTSMATPHMTGAVALCLGEAGGSGPCTGLTPAQIVGRMRADAARWTANTPGYGFTGDPAHAISGRYYGYLGWAGLDRTAPTAGTASPAAAATGVGISSPVRVTFSEPMDHASTQSAFALRRTSTGAAVGGSFTWSGTTMTFTPSAALAGAAGYTATVGTGALDPAGNRLAAARTWSFTTATTTVTAPGAVVAMTGAFKSGSVTSLRTDDNIYLVEGSAGTAPAASWYGRMTGVDNAVRDLRVTYQGKASATATQIVYLWNWTTSKWVAVDTRNVGTTELRVDRPATGTLADYVSGTTGLGEVRVQVRSTRSTAFTTSGDLMFVTWSR